MQTTGTQDVLSGLAEKQRVQVVARYRMANGRFSAWADSDRRAMAQALFEVEDELEHRLASTGMAPSDPRMGPVRALKSASQCSAG